MDAWRVVIVSQAGPVVAGLTLGLRAAGHDPVAVVATRKNASAPDGGAFFVRLFTESPPELDILIPADKTRIAPLIAPLEPDLVVCSGFSWLIPPDALAVPRLGAINLHPSALPRWRGPQPIAWAVRAGDPELGMTIHRMDDRFDTGPVLAQARVPLDDDAWTWDELGPKLQALAAQALPEALARVAAREPGEPQPAADGPYAHFFEDDYVHVAFDRPVEEVLRQLRAWQFSSPTPTGARGPLAELDGETVRVLRASATPADGKRVECADGAIWIVKSEPVSPPR